MGTGGKRPCDEIAKMCSGKFTAADSLPPVCQLPNETMFRLCAARDASDASPSPLRPCADLFSTSPDDTLGAMPKRAMLSLMRCETAASMTTHEEMNALDVYGHQATRTCQHLFLYTALIVVGLLSSCRLEQTPKTFERQNKVPFPAVKDLSTLKITLRRTICLGTCPSYRVEVDGSGAVIFDGDEFVDIPGRHTAHISESSVRALLEAFRRAEYFSAKDSYVSPVIDCPTYITSLAIDGTNKKIVDVMGERAGMPDAIRALEEKIDDVAGTARWIKANGSEALTVLDSEKWDYRASTADNMAVYSAAIKNSNVALLGRYRFTGAPVVAQPFSGPSPVCVASGTGDIELIKRMTKPYTVQARETPGRPVIPMRVMNQCLASAAEKGDLPTLQFWLDMGADPTMQAESTLPTDSGGRPRQNQITLLAEAIFSRKADVVRKVLEYKVDMTAPPDDTSLLFFALRITGEDTPAIVESLVKAGANVNEHDGFLHQTPLFNAYNAPGAVKVLLAAGANIEARDDAGNTPLIRGAMVEAMVRELLADGADPKAVAKNGDTALKVSEKYNCAACTSLIAASLKQRTLLQNRLTALVTPHSESLDDRLLRDLLDSRRNARSERLLN